MEIENTKVEDRQINQTARHEQEIAKVVVTFRSKNCDFPQRLTDSAAIFDTKIKLRTRAF